MIEMIDLHSTGCSSCVDAAKKIRLLVYKELKNGGTTPSFHLTIIYSCVETRYHDVK